MWWWYRWVRWVALLVAVWGRGAEGVYRSSAVVKTRYGDIRGVIKTPDFGDLRPVAVYLGVPYAAPPIRKLRFMPPMSPLVWHGIRKSDTLPPVCPQKLPDVTNRKEALKRMPEGRYNYLQRLLPLLRNQSEDCLYLNIYAPAPDPMWPRREQHPVMVYIHGESYEWNSGNPYDGSVLAAYGQVVVVTVNYRLGILGFLRPSLKKHHTSNFGLLDQIAALHWIKENIAGFGGDPGRVTIVGHGTGAALANLLLISPVAQVSGGLFQRAILMSGSALSRWAVTWDPYQYTLQVALAMDCLLTDRGEELVNCLREKSLSQLLNVRLDVEPFTTPLGPIIDGIIVKDEPFKTMSTDHMLGKYELLYGVALAESYHMLTAKEVRDGMDQERMRRLARAYINNNFKHHANPVYATVIEYYEPQRSGTRIDNERVRDQTLEMMSDAQIIAPVVEMAGLHSDRNSKSFLYCFNHQSMYGDYPVSQGTVHGEELAYVFGAPLVGGFNHFGLNYTHQEKFLSELVMTLWTNFARTGNPNLPAPQKFLTPRPDERWEQNLRQMWPFYRSSTQDYLHIDMKVESKSHYRNHKMSLWNRLIPAIITSVVGPEVPTPPPRPTSIDLVPTPPRNIWTEIEKAKPPPKPTPGWRTPVQPVPEYIPPANPRQPPPDLPPLPPQYVDPDPILEEPPAPPPPAPSYAGTPISIVILVGIGILFINCCAMGAVYYQRDKIKFQNMFMRTFRRGNNSEVEAGEEEHISEAPSLNSSSKGEKRSRKSRSDYEVSDSAQSDSVSRASAVSKDSSNKRKLHRQSSHDSSRHKDTDTPKSGHKSSSSSNRDGKSSSSSSRDGKSSSGHRRHKSEVSVYSEIPKTSDVHVHGEGEGGRSVSRSGSRASTKRYPTVTFNDGKGLPPKSLTKSSTSISSKASVTSHASIKSTTSRASNKSTTSRASIKSTTSEKRLKKNASCQSLPTVEYTWGITKEMTMTERRDDPEGHDDQRAPADGEQILATMQKLNCPKVLPDRHDMGHAATLPKVRPPPPPRSTSLTAKDIQDLEETVHVVYRNKKRNPRRDASTDSCDLTGIDIYGVGREPVAPVSMYGTPPVTATVSRSRARKSDGTEYGVTGASPATTPTDQIRPPPTADYGRTSTTPPDYSPKISDETHGTRYPVYEPTYVYKDGKPPEHHSPTHSVDPNKIYETYNETRSPRGALATFGKSNHVTGGGAPATSPTRSAPSYDTSVKSAYDNSVKSGYAQNSTAVVTAAAQTALATVTAPAFVGASSLGRSAPRGPAPVPAATHTSALRHQSSNASSDASTVYEQSENTGTIKRRKSTKKDATTDTTSTSTNHKGSSTAEKPLKSVLKQTSAYDKQPVPKMAKGPGASPSTSNSNLSSSIVHSGSSGHSVAVGTGGPSVTSGHGGHSSSASSDPSSKSASLKRIHRVATPGSKRKTKSDNQTSTDVQTEPIK